MAMSTALAQLQKVTRFFQNLQSSQLQTDPETQFQLHLAQKETRSKRQRKERLLKVWLQLVLVQLKQQREKQQKPPKPPKLRRVMPSAVQLRRVRSFESFRHSSQHFQSHSDQTFEPGGHGISLWPLRAFWSSQHSTLLEVSASVSTEVPRRRCR